MDGANKWHKMIHIDVPALLPTATIMFIMRMGSVMSIGFEKVYLLQNTLNSTSSEIISTYVYKIAYSARTAHPFQRNGAPFRFKLSKAQHVY